MIPLHYFSDSIIFMLLNFSIAMYIFRRFFAVMKSHYKLVAEISEFNAIVLQSRMSLDYMNSQVSEAMKEIEGDIGKELYLTHNLTKISSKMGMILRRFNALEEGVIELVRMEHNTESIKIETPSDINTEVKKILVAARKKERINTSERPKTPKKLKISTSTYQGVNEPQVQNPLTKFSTVQPPNRGKINLLEISNSTMSKGETRNSIDKPVVKLLTEKKNEHFSKPIGFRPSWKCES